MEENHELELAWQVIENTGTHLFLTGKAGTGKTTFLRRLKELTPKRMVVVAPTGIAAINAGGVTIHSFFQLNFAPYIPESTFNSAQQSFHKFGKEKINIIRSMDLLVIDEISMVRADQLDAVDSVLRRYRDRSKPFGGVQLLMIGDLQQLAPVVKEEDWNLLTSYYDTAFFFGSHSLKETEYITIELKKVYRQSDTAFVGLLNKIRDKEADESVLEELNKRYLPEFRPREEEGYIRLTTHNYQAQQYNDRQLLSLSGRAFSFQARVEGTFPESAYPADEMLTVKEGAQIMFIKNDSSGEHRYYNGMIGLVTAVGKDGIRVKGNGESQDFLLETEEWTNSKYSLNPQTKEITEEVEGTFRQYPIRLAWAITIHKSQGLTFERAIIDANASFAHGQVYVALSRCKSLQGLVLSSPLRRESIISDDTIDEFTRNAGELTPDKHKLALLRQHYFYELLCEQFDFHPLEQHFARVLRLLDEHLYRLYPKLLERYKETIDLYKAQIMKVADTFKLQYSTLLMEVEDYDANPKLNERIVAGAHYFRKHLEDLLNPLMVSTKVETDNKELKKKFSEALDTLKTTLHVKLGTLYYTEKEGFTVSAFLKHKAVLTLSVSGGESTSSSGRSERKPRTAEKIEVPTDILHPELYKQLIAWRNSEASKANLPVYTVIQQKAILGIVNLLPCDTASLVRIPYFGKRGAEKYGDVLLEMVSRYVKEQGIERPPMPAITLTLKKETKEPKEPKPLKETKPVKEPKLDTKEITYRLFRQGKNIEEIAKERELVSGTIAGHLEHYVRLGAVKIEQLVTKEKIMKITRYVQANGSDKGLTAIKAALGDEVSYADIRLVLAAEKKES
ncbi:helix-turn-helix domain-containing protein [Bacteroides hominis]|uniref:helix-turn-helix domain-containing protein n=1 Tax=Bacteroides hominis TaxID=2763023 RepID=UPI002948F610|nr:helix-turn-helix domain-containing protein [Bacteroides hominis (ex Liu et al. 2022)]MDV6203476.1 helix-turn-helix domain-containing protein [Bacteroides hominis (ex Liu et al. 2022)]